MDARTQEKRAAAIAQLSALLEHRLGVAWTRMGPATCQRVAAVLADVGADAVMDAVKREREACAAIADEREAEGWQRAGIAIIDNAERRHKGAAEASREIAAKIRARGEVANGG